MERFTRETVKNIAEDINKALENIANKHGVSVSAGSIIYDEHKFTCRITGLSKAHCNGDKDGDLNKYEIHAMNKKYQKLYQITEDMIGKEYHYGQVVYTFAGLSPSRRKYPYIFKQRSSGRYTAFPTAVAQLILGISNEKLFGAVEVPQAPVITKK